LIILQTKVLLTIGLFLLAVNPVQAVIISEVYPQPNTGESEWIELYNPDGTATSIEGWQVFDQLSSPSLLTTLSGSIEPNAFLVINLSGSKLNNPGDGVGLLDATGQIMDEMAYSSSQVGLAWALIGTSWQITEATPNSINQPYPTPSPLPTIIPSTMPPSPPPSPTPQTNSISSFDVNSVSITEVMACPTNGQKEWLEFYNSSDLVIQLRDWQIRDSKDQTIVVNLDLLPHTYQVFEWSKSLLNNDGDEVKLLSDQSQVLSQIELSACQLGLSWQLLDGNWWLDQPTPYQANQKTSSSPTATPTPTSSTFNSTSPTPTIKATSADAIITNNQAPPQPPNVVSPDLTRARIASVAGVSVSLDNLSGIVNQKFSWEAGLSAIMGGLFFQVAGGISWYAKKLPLTHPQMA